jgi:multisubunit Na+/H+ antiporter MnhE subunit
MESVDPMLIAFLPKDIRSMFFPFASVQLLALLMNLLIGFAIASLIGFHFRKYASAFCNRQDFSRLFPLLMLSVILIITVVKASLALALGLVGALSIVRFRTPIKEPEELLYLFLNIGVAVALGAGQTLAAVLACLVTLMLVTLAKRGNQNQTSENGLFLSLHHMNEVGYQETQLLSSLKSILQQHVERIELRRIDVTSTQFDATFFVAVNDEQQIDKFISALNDEFSGINVSLLEQHNIAGV